VKEVQDSQPRVQGRLDRKTQRLGLMLTAFLFILESPPSARTGGRRKDSINVEAHQSTCLHPALYSAECMAGQFRNDLFNPSRDAEYLPFFSKFNYFLQSFDLLTVV
jgi:hypothetical protein